MNGIFPLRQANENEKRGFLNWIAEHDPTSYWQIANSSFVLLISTIPINCTIRSLPGEHSVKIITEGQAAEMRR